MVSLRAVKWWGSSFCNGSRSGTGDVIQSYHPEARDIHAGGWMIKTIDHHTAMTLADACAVRDHDALVMHVL